LNNGMQQLGEDLEIVSNGTDTAILARLPAIGSPQQYLLKVAVVFALYFAAGRLGLSVPFTSGNVSPVWPASGVALALVLLWGYEVWPGLALAAFLVNFLSPIPVLSCIGIALGNTSSALLGGYLLRRFLLDRPSFERLRDVLGVMAFGGAIGPMLAASVGATTLLLTHVRAWSGFSSAWQIWLGDAMGVLIVTPLFFPTRRERTTPFKKSSMIEPFALLFGLVATCLAIFGGRLGLGMKDDALAFLAFPFVIWAAIRFRAFGAARIARQFWTAASGVEYEPGSFGFRIRENRSPYSEGDQGESQPCEGTLKTAAHDLAFAASPAAG
jgi:integral membrane sensor domain MASE1